MWHGSERGMKVSRAASLILFIIALVLDIVVLCGTTAEPDVRQHGLLMVAAGAVAEVAGQLFVPALFIGIWVGLSKVRKLPLPDNFARNALMVLAGICLVFALVNFLDYQH
jgi:hypothetical protein